MLTIRNHSSIFPVHPIQILVAILLLLELCLIRFKRIDDKQGIVQITTTSWVDVNVEGVEDFYRGAVLNNTLFFNFSDTVLHGHSGLTSLIVMRDCFVNCWIQLLIVLRRCLTHLQCLLKLSNLFLGLYREHVIYRDFDFNSRHIAYPPSLQYRSAFIHHSTNIVINKLDSVQLGSELPIQQ